MPYDKRRKQAFVIELPDSKPANSFPAVIKLGRRKFEAADIFTQKSSGTSNSNWMTLTPKSDYVGRNPWDWAHDICHQMEQVVAEPVYVEPDIEQSWPYLNREVIDESQPSLLGEDCKQNGPDSSWPDGDGFAWHLDDVHSQLKQAREKVRVTGAGDSVRIAILDTGYDPAHITRPENINTDLEFSIIEDIPSAKDPGKRGLLFNPGHGTGTIGILAGNKIQVVDKNGRLLFDDYLGGAPEAEIVPVRVANSVVHLWTSSLAKGIDYAIDFNGKDDRASDIISISMGGLPSRLWASAVNRAYEAGVVIVAAAGNNFGGLPMRDIVWPARFNRVIAATGVTSKLTPYVKSGISFKMQGNYGPAEAMTSALAASTPNIPWAELGCIDVIDLDGAGTSSATPQIASASGLWLAFHKGKFGGGWQKVEAVRQALFSSADKSQEESDKYYGQGVLKADDALYVQVNTLAELSKQPEDEIKFPFLHELSGWDELLTVTCQMFEVEAMQLYAKEPGLHRLYPGLEDGRPGGTTCEEVAKTYCDLPTISNKLRRFLLTAIASN